MLWRGKFCWLKLFGRNWLNTHLFGRQWAAVRIYLSERIAPPQKCSNWYCIEHWCGAIPSAASTPPIILGKATPSKRQLLFKFKINILDDSHLLHWPSILSQKRKRIERKLQISFCCFVSLVIMKLNLQPVYIQTSSGSNQIVLQTDKAEAFGMRASNKSHILLYVRM